MDGFFYLIVKFVQSINQFFDILQKKQTSLLWSPSAAKDEIYIDDEALEGSGNREIKDDLESSGSGFGPDDEDGEGGSGVSGTILKILSVGLSGNFCT